MSYWTSLEISIKRNYFEPARTNLGYIEIFGIGPADSIILSCQTNGLPNLSNEEIEMPFGNDRSWIAGKRSNEAISVTFIDYIDTDIVGILSAWQRLVYNPDTGQLGFARNYKKSALISQLQPDGNVLREWELNGVWPQAINFGTLDQSGNDRVSVEVTLRADQIRPLF
jgi:hypothetical protein